MPDKQLPMPNEPGFAHVAFAVDDVEAALEAVTSAGGNSVGEIATTEVRGVGLLQVVYARDPEGNIVELQKWC
jgi:predicted enzyme related to lactoylglutathione lyase